jgi:DegV family protein with EDD domain
MVDRWGVTVVPMGVDIDGAAFLERVDITPTEFYDRMARSAGLPKTSQPSPASFEKAFESVAHDGPILCVTVSSKLSGTYQSACLAAKLSGADVTVFDTLNASLGQGLQVLRACELAAAGRTVDEIVAELTGYRDQMNTLVLLNTLENIVRGGRLNRFQGSVSKVLDIRVLLHNVEGEVVLLEKVHGGRRLLEQALHKAYELCPDMSGRGVGITHFRNPEGVNHLVHALQERVRPSHFIVSEMGTSMATYAGEGGIILSF